mgnify:CR=1 FL=1
MLQQIEIEILSEQLYENNDKQPWQLSDEEIQHLSWILDFEN